MFLTDWMVIIKAHLRYMDFHYAHKLVYMVFVCQEIIDWVIWLNIKYLLSCNEINFSKMSCKWLQINFADYSKCPIPPIIQQMSLFVFCAAHQLYLVLIKFKCLV